MDICYLRGQLGDDGDAEGNMSEIDSESQTLTS